MCNTFYARFKLGIPKKIRGSGMRLIVATVRGGLDDYVNQSFGRTPTFTIVDVDEMGTLSMFKLLRIPGIHNLEGQE